jgi:hypothetical protein
MLVFTGDMAEARGWHRASRGGSGSPSGWLGMEAAKAAQAAAFRHWWAPPVAIVKSPRILQHGAKDGKLRTDFLEGNPWGGRRAP